MSIRQSSGLPAPRRTSVKALAAAVATCGLLVAVMGCGEGEGVAEDATVTAYVVKPLCAEAERELERQGGRAGELRVQSVCLPSPRSPEKLDLARIGTNARQATEDSTAIAYIEPLDPNASRFSDPILETASIASIPTSSGSKAIAQLLQAIETSDSGSLRESVADELH